MSTKYDTADEIERQEPVAYLQKDQLRQIKRRGPAVGYIGTGPRIDCVPVYAAPPPAPDVSALVEAMERVLYCNEVGFLPESVQQAVSDSLAAHRKGGEA